MGRVPNMNNVLLSFGHDEIQFLSWNGRGICVSDSFERSRLGNMVRKLSNGRQVLCFQEVHGLEAEIIHQFQVWLPGWKIFCSVSISADGTQSPGAGGVVTAICPKLKGMANLMDTVLVPGRCLVTSILLGSKVLTVLNLHNYGFKVPQVQRIGNFMSSLALDVKNDPSSQIGILLGDLNIKAEDERSFKVGRNFVRKVMTHDFANPVYSGTHIRQWESILSEWTEVVQPFPTHFDPKGLSCSRIDRAWVTCPSSLLTKIQSSSFVISSPEVMYGEGLSDHAPFVVSFGKVPNVEVAQHPIPVHICRKPRFKTHLNSLINDVGVFDLPQERQLPCYKVCIREAAKRIKFELAYQDQESLPSMRLTLSSISRAIWFGNAGLARKLLRSSELAKSLLVVNGGHVSCSSFERFDDLFNYAHKEVQTRQIRNLGIAIGRTSSTNLKKQLKSKLQAAKRLERIFWPSGKRLSLTGLKLEDDDVGQLGRSFDPTDTCITDETDEKKTTVGVPQVPGTSNIVTSQSGIQQALAGYWGKVYELRHLDRDKAEAFLNVYRNRQGHLFSFNHLELPTEDMYIERIRSATDSATGPDGVPYAAYKAIPEASARVLSATTQDLSSAEPLTDFELLNQQLVWFAPKGQSDQDGTAVIRTPGNLRTIFGSNVDTKLIAGTIAHEMTEPMLKVTPGAQRGFCRGRQLALNVVDLDVYMRMFNNQFDATNIMKDIGSIPVSALYDFCNAFPSLLHEWIFLVLEVLQVPTLIRKVILSLYTCITAYSSGVGDGSFLFRVLGGVRTGCPLSSVLFILCINPFVHLFVMLSDNPGYSLTRVCADDFGSALKVLKTLKTHFSIFNVASQIAGLHLKPSKCVIIVSCCLLTEEVEFAIRSWLRLHVPAFKDFLIQQSGKYLGWNLGVNAVSISFKDPVNKFVHRIEEICSGKAPAATSICRYNQRAISVLSYVAQFAVPPEDVNMSGLAHWAIHRILRMPPNSMSRKLCHSLGFCTVIEPIPLASYCAAILFRFAHSEKEYLLNLQKDAVALVGDSLALGRTNAHGIPEGGLACPPILCALLDAIHLDGPLKQVRSICASNPAHNWILSFPERPLPSNSRGLQSAVLDIFKVKDRVSDFTKEMSHKATVTLGHDWAASIHLLPSWFHDLEKLLLSVPLFLRVCWLKTIAGAWCTSIRLHTNSGWPCIFGCVDAKDELRHYLVCPILWQFPRESLHICEPSLLVESRLCMFEPSLDKLKVLAFCHALYHACRNDQGCINSDGGINPAIIVQQRASDLCRYVRHLVSCES